MLKETKKFDVLTVSRYYKQTWTEHRCQNLDQWFIWHRNFMMLTWSLTIAGFIMILLELKVPVAGLFSPILSHLLSRV